jgi:hypothetical protein
MNNSMPANERGVGGSSQLHRVPEHGFAKKTQLPKKQTKYQNIAQIITKEIKTKKLKTYN